MNKKKDFEKVLKSTRSFKSNFLLLKTSNNALGVTRIGFIVSQKVSKEAVTRNKVRRRLREAVGPGLGRIKKGKDIVFITLSGIEKQDFSETEETVNRLLAESGLLASNPKR